MSHIIRTVEEFKELDPDTALSDRDGQLLWGNDPYMSCMTEQEIQESLPAVVIAIGEHVRAAQKALKEQL